MVGFSSDGHRYMWHLQRPKLFILPLHSVILAGCSTVASVCNDWRCVFEMGNCFHIHNTIFMKNTYSTHVSHQCLYWETVTFSQKRSELKCLYDPDWRCSLVCLRPRCNQNPHIITVVYLSIEGSTINCIESKRMRWSIGCRQSPALAQNTVVSWERIHPKAELCHSARWDEDHKYEASRGCSSSFCLGSSPAARANLGQEDPSES